MMSHENISQSLRAAEKALKHFLASLDQSGFLDGHKPYTEMGNVLLSQMLWMQNEGLHDLDDEFQRIGELAFGIHARLNPYVEIMMRLSALKSLSSIPNEFDHSTTEGKILEILIASPKPVSLTAIRRRVKENTQEIKRVLNWLVESGRVKKSGASSRPTYALEHGTAQK